MKLGLVSETKTGVNIFPLLEQLLAEQVADFEFREEFVPGMLDIPLRVQELSEDVDIVFVFSLYKENDFRVNSFTEKLVDVELKTGIRVIKGIEESDIEEIVDATEIEAEKERLAKKYAELILDVLFSPENLVPENIDK